MRNHPWTLVTGNFFTLTYRVLDAASSSSRGIPKSKRWKNSLRIDRFRYSFVLDAGKKLSPKLSILSVSASKIRVKKPRWPRPEKKGGIRRKRHQRKKEREKGSTYSSTPDDSLESSATSPRGKWVHSRWYRAVVSVTGIESLGWRIYMYIRHENSIDNVPLHMSIFRARREEKGKGEKGEKEGGKNPWEMQ